MSGSRAFLGKKNPFSVLAMQSNASCFGFVRFAVRIVQTQQSNKGFKVTRLQQRKLKSLRDQLRSCCYLFTLARRGLPSEELTVNDQLNDSGVANRSEHDDEHKQSNQQESHHRRAIIFQHRNRPRSLCAITVPNTVIGWTPGPPLLARQAS